MNFRRLIAKSQKKWQRRLVAWKSDQKELAWREWRSFCKKRQKVFDAMDAKVPCSVFMLVCMIRRLAGLWVAPGNSVRYHEFRPLGGPPGFRSVGSNLWENAVRLVEDG